MYCSSLFCSQFPSWCPGSLLPNGSAPTRLCQHADAFSCISHHIFPPLTSRQACDSLKPSQLLCFCSLHLSNKTAVAFPVGLGFQDADLMLEWQVISLYLGDDGAGRAASDCDVCLSVFLSVQVQNASDLLIKPLEKFRKEQIGVTKVCFHRFPPLREVTSWVRARNSDQWLHTLTSLCAQVSNPHTTSCTRRCWEHRYTVQPVTDDTLQLQYNLSHTSSDAVWP